MFKKIMKRRGIHNRVPRSRNRDPKIYLNVNSRLKTLTFRPQNAIINHDQLIEIKKSPFEPRYYSVAILIKDIVAIALDQEIKVYIQVKVCKYLLASDKFRKTLMKRIKETANNIEIFLTKSERARLPENKTKWDKKAKDEDSHYKYLEEFKNMLLENSAKIEK